MPPEFTDLSDGQAPNAPHRGYTSAMLYSLLGKIEDHAALTQAVAAMASSAISGGALVYAAITLRAVQRQTESSIALTTETFRPVVEITSGDHQTLGFQNKGAGPALNFRWRINQEPPTWRTSGKNLIAPQEKGNFTVQGPFTEKGLVLSYNSAAHPEEIITYVKVLKSGSITNQHAFTAAGGSRTRTGWTLANPELETPGYAPSFLAGQPVLSRLRHAWMILRGRERLL